MKELLSVLSQQAYTMLLLLALLAPSVLAAPQILTAANLYNETLTRSKIFSLAAAAYSSTPATCIDNVLTGATFRRSLEVSCDWTITDKCSGFTAVSPNDQAIIISFRGSNSDLELLMEGDETLFKNNSAWAPGGTVSKFFYDGFTKLWNKGMKDDFNTFANKYPKYQLWITGHSLGGALASLAASYISNNKLFPAKQILLTTFGQPRTGDQAFATQHDKDVPISFRVVHSHDPVPHFPRINQQGYYHHLTEVYYFKEMDVGSKFYVCSNMDESQFCSDGNITPDMSIKEHKNYFQHKVGDFGNAGCQ